MCELALAGSEGHLWFWRIRIFDRKSLGSGGFCESLEIGGVREELEQRCELGLVAERGGGGVAVDVVDRGGRESGVDEGLAHGSERPVSGGADYMLCVV